MNTLKAIESDKHYFGACPKCEANDGYVNVGSTHYMVCDRHKLAWCIGGGLFSDWREETEEVWERNREKLQSYQQIGY